MSRLTKKQIDDITPDIVYYNIIITPERDRSRTLAVYEETRVEPIINNPNDYYMSIVRFSIDGSWIPLFIAPVVPNPLNPQDANLMPYLFSLTYLGTMYNVNVVYIPENNARIPNAPYLSNGLIIQDVSTNYYFVYYYTTLINLLNTAIYKAFYGYTDPFLVPIPPHHVNGLFDDYPDLPGISTPIPYYIYDPVIQKISLIVPNVLHPVSGVNLYITQFDANGIPLSSLTGATNIQIFENEQLYSVLDGIEAFTYNFNENLILVRDLKNNYYYPPQNLLNPNPPEIDETAISFSDPVSNITYTTSPTWFIFTQQYNILSKINTLSNIVFLTRQIPIQPEYIPSSAFSFRDQGLAAFRPIVTDFALNIDNAGETRSRFIYNPEGPYRLIDLKSNIPLKKIDIQLYWQDQYQNLYPLYVSANESDTIKIMFIKKSLVKYDIRNY